MKCKTYTMKIIKTLLVEIKGPKEMERYPLFIDHKI